MNVFDLILLGIALSMDASALTIANCTVYSKTLNKKKEWAMPTAFALFQGLMPLIGYYIGSTFANSIKSFSGYITATIFFILGAKIIFDLIKEKNSKTEKEKKEEKFTISLLLIQSIATSIDAFFVGVTLSFELAFSVYIAVLIIAVVTFVVVAVALLFGKYLGKVFGKYAEYVGAIILFAIAIKTLIEAII